MNILKYIGKTNIFCLLLIYFIVILLFGTILQKNIDIVQIKHYYFLSFIIWIFDFIPVPGGWTILLLLLLNLMSKIILNNWDWKNIYVNIIHCIIFFGILGGWATLYLTKNGYIHIINQNKINCIKTYNKELMIMKKHNHLLTIRMDNKILDQKKFLIHKSLPFIIYLFDYNSMINKTQNKNIFNTFLFYNIKRINNDISLDHKLNLDSSYDGYIFLILGNNNNGIYSILNNIKSKQILTHNNDYSIKLNNQKIKIPFVVYLKKFIYEIYPETKISKDYISFVMIDTILFKWNSVLKMNKPFKYKGYVFYQASIIDNGPINIITFTVNKNLCFAIPYFFLLIFCLTIFFLLKNKLKSY